MLDVNFFRDLGPLTRKLNMFSRDSSGYPPNDEEYKKTRQLQKKVLNHMIDLEATQKNLNDDAFLLALTGQVPIDKLLYRMQKIKNIEIKG